MKHMKCFLISAFIISSISSVNAQEITVMISGGFSTALEKLKPQYEVATGDRINIIHGPSMGNSPEAIPHRLAAGQYTDVVIMVGYALDKLQQEGKITQGSRTELADSRIGMVVRAGENVPKIRTIDELRTTLQKAKSIAYSDSASGQYVQKELFDKLGLSDEVKVKAKMIEKTPVALMVAKGDYEIGFQQVSELLPIKGVTFVGRIPEQIQYVTRFSGAVVTGSTQQNHARRLLHFLASNQAQKIIQETGLDSISTK